MQPEPAAGAGIDPSTSSITTGAGAAFKKYPSAPPPGAGFPGIDISPEFMLLIRNEMGEKGLSDILQSWKDIAAHLGKDIRTCYRWAAELDLPVHRVNERSSRSKVFAYRTELDAWLRDRPKRGARDGASNGRSTPHRAIWLAGGLLLAAGLGFLVIGRPAAPPEDPYPMIAVAPLENLNPEAPDEYFSEEVTREIVNRLSAAGRASLIPATLVDEVEKSLGNPKLLVRSPLGADYLLKGSVRKGETSVRGNFELIRFRDAGRVLNLQFDERLENVDALAENLMARISETLDLPRTPPRAPWGEGAATADFAARDNVMKGRYLLAKLGQGAASGPWVLYHQGRHYSGLASRETNDLAVKLFMQALESDERFALAHIGLAACYANYVNFGWDSQEKWLDTAEAVLRRAQELSPGLAEYYATLVQVLLLKNVSFGSPRREEAYALAEAGIARHPHHPEMNSIAGYCHFLRFGETGRMEDFARALEYKEKAFLMDMYAIGNLVYSELLMLEGDLDTAIRVCELLKTFDAGRYSLFRLGEIWYYLGDLDRCEGLMGELQFSLEDKAEALLFEAMAAASRGDAARAAERLQLRAVFMPPAEGDGFSMEDLRLASVHLGLKQREAGLERLRDFFRQEKVRRFRHIYAKYVALDRNFEAYRDDKDFQNIVNGVDAWPKAEPSA